MRSSPPIFRVIQCDEGAAPLLGFAKAQAQRLIDGGLKNFSKTWPMGDLTARVQSVEFVGDVIVKIWLIAGAVWWTTRRRISNPDALPDEHISEESRWLANAALQPASRVGPERPRLYDVPFDPVRTTLGRNANDEVMLATSAADGDVWVGWLSKHDRGGHFTTAHPVSASTLAQVRLSRAGKRVIMIRWSGVDYSVDSTSWLRFMQKADVVFSPLTPINDGDPTIETQVTVTSLVAHDTVDGEVDGLRLSRPRFNRAQTKAYCVAMDPDSRDLVQVHAIDIDSGARNVVVELQYPGRGVAGWVLRADEAGRPWLALTIVDAVQVTVEVYRGETKVFERTSPGGGDVLAGGTVSAHEFDATSEDGETFACVFGEVTPLRRRGFVVRGDDLFVGPDFADGFFGAGPIVRGDGLAVLLENVAAGGAPRTLILRGPDNQPFRMIAVVEMEGAIQEGATALYQHAGSLRAYSTSGNEAIVHEIIERDAVWTHSSVRHTARDPANVTSTVLEPISHARYWR